jgi:hypothetical protein
MQVTEALNSDWGWETVSETISGKMRVGCVIFIASPAIRRFLTETDDVTRRQINRLSTELVNGIVEDMWISGKRNFTWLKDNSMSPLFHRPDEK